MEDYFLKNIYNLGYAQKVSNHLGVVVYISLAYALYSIFTV